MQKSIKERVLSAINTVMPLDDYDPGNSLYSVEYRINSVDMVYILMQLSKDFNFDICDDFVDAMENITFAQFEELLFRYENGQAA